MTSGRRQQRLGAVLWLSLLGVLLPAARGGAQSPPYRLTVQPREMATGTRTVGAGEHQLQSNPMDWVYVPPQCVGTARWRLVGDTLWLGNDYEPYFHPMIAPRMEAIQQQGWGLGVMDTTVINQRPPYPVPDSVYWSNAFRDSTTACWGYSGNRCGTWAYQVSKHDQDLILVRLDSLSRATAGVAAKAVLSRDSLVNCTWWQCD